MDCDASDDTRQLLRRDEGGEVAARGDDWDVAGSCERELYLEEGETEDESRLELKAPSLLGLLHTEEDPRGSSKFKDSDPLGLSLLLRFSSLRLEIPLGLSLDCCCC